MKPEQKKALINLVGDKISFDRPMDKYTTWQVGGTCEALYMPNDLEELAQVIDYLNQEGIFYLPVGGGSNLLVKDKGIDGLVILLKGSLASVEYQHGEFLWVGAGLHLGKLLGFSRSHGLTGLEWAAGIPGTMGGAVAMNAGAFGKEMETRVEEIRMITPQGMTANRPRSRLRFSYRHLELEKGAVIVKVKLNLKKSTEKNVSASITEFLRMRKISQPLDYPSAGSVFKNPPSESAGRLIENSGLKGKRIGGAMISEKHANFIVNQGGATAQDILDLIGLVKNEVKKTTGIDLELEIRVVGR